MIKRKTYKNYDQFVKIGRKYYNDEGFCGVVAVAVGAQVSFGKARAELERQGRQHRQGTATYQIERALNVLGCSVKTAFADNIAFSSLVKKLDKSKTYLVYTRGHVTCIDKGVIMDWMTANRRHKVMFIQQITREF